MVYGVITYLSPRPSAELSVITVVSELSHSVITVVSELSHSVITVVSELSYSVITVVRELSHSVCTAPSPQQVITFQTKCAPGTALGHSYPVCGHRKWITLCN